MTDTQTLREKRDMEHMLKSPLKLVTNLEAERAVLEALCHDPDKTAWIACSREAVSDLDFATQEPYHRHAYRCIAALHRAGAPVTPATLLAELRRSAAPSQGYDLDHVVKTLFAAAPGQHLADAIRELKRAGAARRAQVECLTLMQGAHVMDVERLSSRLGELSHGVGAGLESDAHSLSSDGGRLSAHWAAIVQQRSDPEGQLKTGVPCFDEMWAGPLVGGRYYMLGGPPKSGKTKLATWMAWQMLSKRQAVIDWFSVEMTFEMTVCSLMGPGWGLTMDQAYSLKPSLADQRLHGGDFEATLALVETVDRCRRELIAMPGELHHRMVGSGVTCEHIVAQIQRRLIEREATGDKRPYIVIVDYLQDVPSGKRGLDERLEISTTSTMLRAACKQHNVPILGIFHTQEASPIKAFGSSKLSKDADVFNVITSSEEEPSERWLQTVLSRHHMPGAPLKLGADLARARFNPDKRTI